MFFKHALGLKVILMITIPVFQEERFGPHGEKEHHLELIMTMLPKNIDVRLKMAMVKHLEVLGQPREILLEVNLSVKHLLIIDVMQAPDKKFTSMRN